jgi:hypothetical protein
LQIPTDGAIKITVVQVSNPVTNKLLGADQRRRGVGSLVQCSNHITSHYIGEWGSNFRVWVSPTGAGDNNNKILMENNVSTGPDSCE